MLSSDPRRFQTVSSLVQHWVTAHRVFLQDLPHLQRLHVVHYEDLVADPGGECARISAFLQLTPPSPLARSARARAGSTSSGGTSGRSWWRPGHWQRRVIEARFGEDLASFGYDLDDLSTHRPWKPDLASTRA